MLTNLSHLKSPFCRDMVIYIAEHQDDPALIEAARHDPDAFAALYQRYLTPLYRYLLQRLNNVHDAEDLITQVFIETLDALINDRYREGGCFPAWLFTVARRRVVDFYRRRSCTALGEMDAATPTVGPTLLPLPTQTLTASDPFLLEVQLLAQKFDAPFQEGPGWNHVIKETLTNLQAGQTFPPPHLKTETWYKIDRDGYILQSVLQDCDDSDQVIQLNATIGNYSTNFTTGDSGFYGDTRRGFSLDLFTNSLSNAFQYGSSITHGEVVCDNGRPCLRVTLQESISPAVQNPGESQAFSGSGQRVWIDTETGQQVKSQSFWRLVDGSERINWTQETTLVEKVDNAPQYILDILSKVVVP